MREGQASFLSASGDGQSTEFDGAPDCTLNAATRTTVPPFLYISAFTHLHLHIYIYTYAFTHLPVHICLYISARVCV